MAYTDIDKSDDYFQTELWSSVDTSIDTLNFQPDFAWIKSRTNADSHVLFDAVRGANKRLNSAETTAEVTTSDELTAFNSNGYTLGTGSNVNRSGNNYVSWNWLASNTTASNTDGSITSTVSANTTSGFSIVTWTAPSSGSNTDTIGHGLSAVPKMIIAKTSSASDGWRVYHNGAGIDKHGAINNSNAFNSNTNIWPTLPTTSIFYPGSDASINSSSRTYVAYCFAEKQGFSKITQYTGNGNSDGPFIYTGFKPAWVLHKGIDNSNGWHLHDNKRDPINPCDNPLFPQSDIAEGSDTLCDFLSNGLKIRSTLGSRNGNGSTYLIMAFAENPFVTSTGIPGLAR
jgi:hypothetical protein